MTVLADRLCVCVAVLILLGLGCRDGGQASKNKKPASANNSAVSSKRQDGHYKKVSIESLLARSDLNEKAKNVFRQRQKNGIKSIIQPAVDSIIAQSLVVDPEFETANSLFGRGEYKTPSKSTFTPSENFEYPKTALTSFERFKGRYQFYRLGIEHFKAKKFRELTDNDKAEIANYMHQVFDTLGLAGQAETWRRLNAKGEQLLAQHQRDLKTDPMFHLCYGAAAGADHDYEKCNKLLHVALDEFSIKKYPARCAVVAHRLFWIYKWDSEPPKSINNRYVRRAIAIKYWLEQDFCATPAEHSYVYDEVEDFMTLASRSRDWKLLRPLVNSVSENKQMPPWIKFMVIGNFNYHLGYAWRGQGYANTVTEEGWKKLESHCQLAEQAYEKAYNINPLLPQPAMEMIRVSRFGYSQQSEKYWFEKSIEHEKGFAAAYNSMSHSLLPQWGGSIEEIFEFAKKHALKSLDSKDPIEGDPAIGFNLIDAVFKLKNESRIDQQEFKEFCLEDDRGQVILDVLDRLIEKNQQTVIYNKLHDKTYLLTVKALIGSTLGDFYRAEEAYEELDTYNQSALRMLRSTSGTFAADRAYVYLEASEYGEDAKELQDIIYKGHQSRTKNYDKIIRLATQLAAETSSTKKKIFERMIEQARLEHDFLKGEDVELTFTPDFRMWVIKDERQVKYISPNEISFDNRKFDINGTMASVAEFPGAKQVDFDITFPPTPKLNANDRLPRNSSDEMVIAALTHQFGNRGESLAIGLKRNNGFTSRGRFSRGANTTMGKLVFGDTGNRGNFNFYNLPMPNRKNHLSIRYDGAYIEIYLNDEFICRTWSHAHRGAYPRVVLATPQHGATGRGIVNISNIRLKKWTPAPFALDDEKVAAHFKRVVKQNPTDKWSAFWYGQVLHRMKKYDQALEQYHKSIELGVRKSHIAFYIGDIYDRKKESEKAKQWYQTSVDLAPDIYPEGIRFMSRMGRTVPDSYPEDWSRFRLEWMVAVTAGDKLEVPNKNRRRGIRMPRNMGDMAGLLQSQYDVARGRPQNAISRTKSTLNKALEIYKPVVQKFLDAYENEKVFQGTEKDARMYLQFEEATPFFRHYEDRLPPAHRDLYRRIQRRPPQRSTSG